MAATTEPAAARPQATLEEAFVEALGNLGRGDKARLKRHAGMSLDESTDVLGPFFRCLPHGVSVRRHDDYFLVATLFPLAGESELRNFGMTMRRMRTESNKAGLDRRMEALLDADRQQLPFRLRQIVRLAHANRVGVNWAQLLHDVIFWEGKERWVQKKWAMSYFASHGRDDESPKPAAEEPEQASSDATDEDA